MRGYEILAAEDLNDNDAHDNTSVAVAIPLDKSGLPCKGRAVRVIGGDRPAGTTEEEGV